MPEPNPNSHHREGPQGRRAAYALATATLLTAMLALSLPARSQELDPNDCPMVYEPGGPVLPGMEMLTVPEITRDSASRTLKGVITIADEERVLWFQDSASKELYCAKQRLRYIKGHSPVHASEAWPASASPAEPLPGPTLRAQVGDIVQLSLLNQVDTSWFGLSYDTLEQGEGCDTTMGEGGEVYPGDTKDTMPNCFHGSSTTNIHFHGTHTTPNTTGDNVYLQIRPATRTNDIPDVTEASVSADFGDFFQQCESRLRARPNVATTWPNLWEEMPEGYRNRQEVLLKHFDNTAQYQGENNGLPPEARLWPKNEASIKARLWPNYYIGAFPYCFELPKYNEKEWPPPPAKDPKKDPPPLQMGQAPGTHWYHAHKHGSTHLNVSNAMTGVLVVSGEYDQKLHDFYKGTDEHKNWGLEEKVLIVQQLGVTPNMQKSAGQVVGGDELYVNGRRQPVLTMRPGEVQMWRIVDTPARNGVYFFGAADRCPDADPSSDPAKCGLEWRQTAQDGVQLAPENYASSGNVNGSFLLAAGNRADLLVRAPELKGTGSMMIPIQIESTTSNRPSDPPNPTTLFTVRVSNDTDRKAGNPSPVMPFPTQAEFPPLPPFLADIDERIYTKRELVFNSTGDPFGTPRVPVSHTIDGDKFDGNTIDQVMLLNKPEEWKIINNTGSQSTVPGIAHPFHIHINPFQVVEVFDPNDKAYQVTDPTADCYLNPDDPATWHPCDKTALAPPYIWWDVFPMPPARRVTGKGGVVHPIPGYFKMRSRFVDYTGQYVLHCHILAHEDRGMMQFVEVVSNKMKGPHH